MLWAARFMRSPPASGMPNILVIDSDSVQRAALVRALDGLGTIEQTGSGLDALRLLASKKFTVILIDLQVRPVDGFVLLRMLATKDGPNKESLVYALAADAAERERALHDHAVFVLMKPLALPTVKVLVEAGVNKPPPGSQTDIPARRAPRADAVHPAVHHPADAAHPAAQRVADPARPAVP